MVAVLCFDESATRLMSGSVKMIEMEMKTKEEENQSLLCVGLYRWFRMWLNVSSKHLSEVCLYVCCLNPRAE